MEIAISVSISGGNHSAVRREIVGRGDQRDRMRDCKRGHDRDQRAEAPERNHQAQQEQQVVGAVEDVEESLLTKRQRRLIPARIEPDQPGIALELERARRAAGRQEPKRGDRAQPQSLEPRVDRELGAVGSIGYSNSTSSSPWFQIEFRVVRQPRAREVRQGLFIRREGFIGRQ